jgi:hypothetical protein
MFVPSVNGKDEEAGHKMSEKHERRRQLGKAAS